MLFFKLKVGRNLINNESLEAVLSMLKTISSLSLELIDISEVTLKPTITEHIAAVTAVHPNFKCLYGFLNLGEKKVHVQNNNALHILLSYCEKNSLSISDLFAKLDKVY